MSPNSCWQFGDILLLSRNDRISSFYWIRGSKHRFLTSFSNLYHSFLFLVFLRKRYLLVSLHPSRLQGNLIPHPVFIPQVLREPCRTCAPIFLAYMTHFLEAQVGNSCRNPPDSCVFRSCGIFFHRNHDYCSAITFSEPHQETCLYGAYVGSYIGFKKRTIHLVRTLSSSQGAPLTSQRR